MPHLTLALLFEMSMTSLLGGQVGRPSGLASSLTLLFSVSQTSDCFWGPVFWATLDDLF